ncbi:CP135 protein, partial [Polyodon spathula]|nr:CP135 protein [Polyodon spathula]
MSSAAERKFINLRKRLDQLGYRQPLGIESLPLVEKLFSDLVHTTESLRNAKLSVGKTEKESKNLDAVLEPYRTENARLVRENNELHLGLLKLKEEKDKLSKDLKSSIRKLEHETTDLKFLNNQYVHKVRSLEKDSKAKTDKIQQLQEKNLQAVVQTPGGKKRTIPFRRQRMQIDQTIPPSFVSSMPVPQPDDPYVADLLQVADNRIQELQQEVTRLKNELERSEGGIRHLNKQVEERDKEIERLGHALDGGRPHDVISLEARNSSNEKLIAHLNLQIEYLQQANRDLEKRVQGLLERKQTVSSEVANLSARNEELCQELTEIDHLAQQLERDKEMVLETADKELLEAKEEIQRQHKDIEDFEDSIAKLKTELEECHHENDKLKDDLLDSREQKQILNGLINQLEQEKKRLADRVEKLTITERELVFELERMQDLHGISRKDKSPSRLDAFVKSLEEERDFFKSEVEYLQRMVKGGESQRRGRSPTRASPVRVPSLKFQLILYGMRTYCVTFHNFYSFRRQSNHYPRVIYQSTCLNPRVYLDPFCSRICIINEPENCCLFLQGGSNEAELMQVVRERDELQAMLDRFEKHMVDVQANVKVLTAERDKLSIFCEQTQDELNRLRKEAIRSPKSQKSVAVPHAVLQRVEEEREEAVADLRRMMMERDTAIDREQLEKRETVMENAIHALEKERCDLRAHVTMLTETKELLEDEIKSQSNKVAQTSDEACHHRAELSSLRFVLRYILYALER